MPINDVRVGPSPPFALWVSARVESAERTATVGINDGSPQYRVIKENKHVIFQRIETSEEIEGREEDIMEQTSRAHILQPKSHTTSVSDEVTKETQRSLVTAIEQLSSPRLRVTYDHSQTVMNIDEGSEINAVSDTFAEKNKFFSYRRSCKLKQKDYGRCISTIGMLN